jgi:tripartite-type tricarboxylate transporter receptor subunit TctC
MGVPNFNQFVSEADRPVAELIVAQQVFSRMFLVTNGVPEDRVTLLREAFLKTLKDEEFLADANKAQLNIDPISGAEVQNVVDRIFGSSQDIVERARKMIAPDR